MGLGHWRLFYNGKSYCSDSEVLNAQKIGISKHAEDIDLNGRGFGGKSILRGFIKREPSKQFLNRITDGSYMEVVDGIKVLKPSIVYLKMVIHIILMLIEI